MNKFNCKICNYITNEKSNLNRHLKSKKHALKVIDINDTKNTHINEKFDDELQHTKISHSTSHSTQHNTQHNTPQNIKLLKNTNKNNLVCDNCDICFSRTSSLVRHQKSCVYKNNELMSLKSK